MDQRLPFTLIYSDLYLMSCLCGCRKPCKHELCWQAEGSYKKNLAEALTPDDVTWLLDQGWDGEFK